MTRIRVLVVVLISLVSANGRPAADDRPLRQGVAGAFRAGVDLVSLSVTVRTTARQYVEDLTREDFRV